MLNSCIAATRLRILFLEATSGFSSLYGIHRMGGFYRSVCLYLERMDHEEAMAKNDGGVDGKLGEFELLSALLKSVF